MIAEDTVLSDRYRIVSVLGRGGMGRVYEAVDLERDERVAVKVLRTAEPRDLRRFASESKVLAQLDHHAIVRMLGTGQHGDTPYLVMQLVGGRSLADELRDGPLDPDQVRRIGRDVADALAYAHRRDVVHRDVKPGNVLIGEDGSAHLADFGIARLADVTGFTSTGVTMGTAAYLAPEQARGGGVGPPADVYALGLVLLEALTGEKAFSGTPTEAAVARLSRDPAIPDRLDDGWRQLLRRLTARDPQARPSAEDVASLLEQEPSAAALDTVALPPGDGDTTTELPSPTTPQRPGRVRRVLPGLVLTVIAVVAVAVVLWALPPDQTRPQPQEPATTAPAAELPQPLEDSLNRLDQEVSG
ncbi:MAG: serine/threonine protein kinase [Actinobacteria bacterium]|nr:serine/threonine protein kinase [Actinomycetota bacterium]